MPASNWGFDVAQDAKSTQVEEALAAVQDPVVGEDIVSAGWVRDVCVKDGDVDFELALPGALYGPEAELVEAAEAAVRAVDGITGVRIRRALDVLGNGPTGNAVAIASGKGGVGKSTVSTNLAVALARAGARVGLVDCDIYGPSVPMLMGADERPKTTEAGKTDPPVLHGVRVMSMGLLVAPDDAMVWRGPMLHKAVVRFLEDVDWGELDYLLLDLPPGTGDIQMTLSQKADIVGALHVTTPQGVALEDVIRGKAMFDRVSVDSLGIVENMSGFVCSKCDKIHEIFGAGGGRRIAESLDIPFMGAVPLEPAVRAGGDEGTPVVLRDSESPAARAFEAVAGALATDVAKRRHQALRQAAAREKAGV